MHEDYTNIYYIRAVCNQFSSRTRVRRPRPLLWRTTKTIIAFRPRRVNISATAVGANIISFTPTGIIVVIRARVENIRFCFINLMFPTQIKYSCETKKKNSTRVSKIKIRIFRVCPMKKYTTVNIKFVSFFRAHISLAKIFKKYIIFFFILLKIKVFIRIFFFSYVRKYELLIIIRFFF